jgi:hypothetical protein
LKQLPDAFKTHRALLRVIDAQMELRHGESAIQPVVQSWIASLRSQ